MNDNPFSLDDFADLLTLRIDRALEEKDTGPPEIGDEVSVEVRDQIRALEDTVQAQEEIPYFEHNELRHLYSEIGNIDRSMYHADRMLIARPLDDYTLNVLSGWQMDSDPPAALRALLQAALDFFELSTLRVSCLVRAGEVCTDYGRDEEALRLLKAAQAHLDADRSHAAAAEAHSYALWLEESASVEVPVAQSRAGNGRFNPITPAQEESLRALIEKHGLEGFAERIVSLAQPCIRFEEAPGREDVVGGTRLGGLPDVPPDWQWPQNLPFLGQFNLAELALHDPNGLLPRHGLLSFFYDQQGYSEQEDGRERRVFFFQDVSVLQRSKAPRGFLPIDLSEEPHCIYKPLAVSPHSSISLPTTYSRLWGEMYESGEGDFNDDAYDALLNELRPWQSEGGRNQVLGHHTFMDGDADEQAQEAQDNRRGAPRRNMASYQSLEQKQSAEREYDEALRQLSEPNNPHNPQGSIYEKLTSLLGLRAWYVYWVNEARHAEEAAQLRQEHQARVSEWVLLFQIDSDDRIGTMFSDAGFAFFMIRKPDLAEARFDRVYAGMWTS